MSIWADNPEYFDEWIENQALKGRFGAEIQAAVESGDLPGYELWGRKDIDPRGDLGCEAEQDYYGRFMQ